MNSVSSRGVTCHVPGSLSHSLSQALRVGWTQSWLLSLSQLSLALVTGEQSEAWPRVRTARASVPSFQSSRGWWEHWQHLPVWLPRQCSPQAVPKGVSGAVSAALRFVVGREWGAQLEVAATL